VARSQPFKMRLLDVEVADLDARAEREGIAKADVIRRAMGWDAVNLVKPSSPAASDGEPAPAPRRPSPSASKEPGVAAASELARRIKERREGGGG
jgi:hypothetical protein